MIRKYANSDLEKILDVWYHASMVAHPFLSEDFIELERENIRNIYILKSETWVYQQKKNVVGFISMLENEVGAIFVHPDFHGEGIGTKLMDFVSKMHQQLEAEVFKENILGRGFYDKYGFKLMEEKVHEKTGLILLRMKYPG